MEHPHRLFKDEFGVLVRPTGCDRMVTRNAKGGSENRRPAVAIQLHREWQLPFSSTENGSYKAFVSILPLQDRKYHACGRLSAECIRYYVSFPPLRLYHSCTCAHNYGNAFEQIHDTLATCGWHATRCVSDAHGDHPAVVSTANEGALCNGCLVQVSVGEVV